MEKTPKHSRRFHKTIRILFGLSLIVGIIGLILTAILPTPQNRIPVSLGMLGMIGAGITAVNLLCDDSCGH